MGGDVRGDVILDDAGVSAGRGSSGAPARSRGELEVALSLRASQPVRVTLTNNGRVMVSARRQSGALEVRLHHMFTRADEETLDAVAQYFRRRTAKARQVLDRFIERHDGAIERSARRVAIRTQGAHHDLRAMFDALNTAWFGGAVDARLTWGIAPVRPRRRSIRLGTYAVREHLIRIHPALDAAWVPDYVVRNVLFHEMLHAVMPAVRVGDRRVFHTKEFRARERAFPDYARAVAWEGEHLPKLLTTRTRAAAPRPRKRRFLLF